MAYPEGRLAGVLHHLLVDCAAKGTGGELRGHHLQLSNFDLRLLTALAQRAFGKSVSLAGGAFGRAFGRVRCRWSLDIRGTRHVFGQHGFCEFSWN